MEDPDRFEIARKRMVDVQIVSRGIHDEATINAFLSVPRHLFVEEALSNQAYNDYPLPIGEGQTISQPYIVALMIQSLGLTADRPCPRDRDGVGLPDRDPGRDRGGGLFRRADRRAGRRRPDKSSENSATTMSTSRSVTAPRGGSNSVRLTRSSWRPRPPTSPGRSSIS